MATENYHVLIVDDDPAAIRLLHRLLHGAAYRVSEAASGEEALEIIERDCPSFLITDWEMPGISGVELCEIIRKMRLPHYIYAIVLTGRTDIHDTAGALRSGADDFLRKPLDRGDLLARMHAGSRIIDLEQHLASLANSDPLTGLATKRTFAEHLERDWSRAKRYRTPMSCVMLDIDFFKRINDTYGHQTGDRVIKTIAGHISQNCRTSDFVARYGGEEFCALLPETNEEQAIVWAERLRERIRTTPIEIEGKPVNITSSFGVAAIEEDVPNALALVELADQCLLAAKQAGRDRVLSATAIRQLSAMYRDPASGQGAIFAGVTARDVMSIVAGVPLDSTVGHAAKYFLRFRMGSAPVVDETGTLVGMLSEKDLMNVLLWPDCWTRPIRDVMKSNVVCYEEETPILTVYEFLSRVPFRSIVVVRDGTPTGVISRGALLRWFSNSIAAAQGGLDGDESHLAGCDADGRGRLSGIAVSIGEQVGQLLTALGNDELDDVLPHVVGGASRIQDLVTQLLAGSPVLRAVWPGGRVGDDTEGSLVGMGFASATEL